MYKFFSFVLIIGFMECVSEVMAEDPLELFTKYKSWEPKSNSFSSDDIRCYCNLPRCVSTGYMCRTARSTSHGSCFSEVTDNNDVSTTARHGCIELLLNDNHNLQCVNHPMKKSSRQVPSSTGSPSNELRVHCCHEDMCNHVDRPDYRKNQLLPNTTSHNVDQDFLINSKPSYVSGENHSEKQLQYPPLLTATSTTTTTTSANGYNSEFWFKVATIAVPICGAVILFVLIGLAIKLLKNDGVGETPSKLVVGNVATGGSNGGGGGGSSCGMGNRKATIDFEAAYGMQHHNAVHQKNMKQIPLLAKRNSNEYFNNQNLQRTGELKNECLAKKNQLMTLEYSLLPQSCHDSKQTNTESGSASLYRNVNLSMNPTNRYHDIGDSKLYEKEVLNPTPYWASSN